LCWTRGANGILKEKNTARNLRKSTGASNTGRQVGTEDAKAAANQSDGISRQKRLLSPAVQALLGMYQQRYYQAHREAVRQSQRQYMEANRPLHREAGARLRAARREQGMSQRELGEVFGVGKGAVCHWEQGRVPYDFKALSRIFPGLKAGGPKHVRTLKPGVLHTRGKACGCTAPEKQSAAKPGCAMAEKNNAAPGKTACCVKTCTQKKEAL
jgi:DNA-binding transcriptional regulator YiaG